MISRKPRGFKGNTRNLKLIDNVEFAEMPARFRVEQQHKKNNFSGKDSNNCKNASGNDSRNNGNTSG